MIFLYTLFKNLDIIMAHLPKIAIVGRPNVGKSALFNRIIKKRVAIVEEEEGVTRDRLYGTSTLFGTPFEIIDTGGMEEKSDRPFNAEVIAQAELAVLEADACIFVVDVKVGVTALDLQVAKKLHASKKHVVVAVNKADNEGLAEQAFAFLSLGFKDVIAVSATQNHFLAELLDATLAPLKEKFAALPAEAKSIKVAILGRPNVGKSSLLNTFLEEERCCVSPESGTTRDAVDVLLTHEGINYTLIDTAGIKRRKAEENTVEKFAKMRTIDALERADIVLFIIDSTVGMTGQDLKILQEIEEAGKSCVLLLNKWDLMHGVQMEHCFTHLREEMPFLDYCPKIIISVKTKRNLEKIFPLVNVVYAESQKRISTGELNRVIEEAIQESHPAMLNGKRLRIYYTSQVGVSPPTFILFVNSPSLMQENYRRYLYNQLRAKFKFLGAPLKLYLKGKKPKVE
jgi:GTPase